MPKPVGRDPIEFDGICMRKSEEVPQGMQALYDRHGNLLGVARIGDDLKLRTKATQITLNPIDYEIVLVSYKRDRNRAHAQA